MYICVYRCIFIYTYISIHNSNASILYHNRPIHNDFISSVAIYNVSMLYSNVSISIYSSLFIMPLFIMSLLNFNSKVFCEGNIQNSLFLRRPSINFNKK